ncbi:tyrosine-protein phosphatase [Kitasatospora sp. NPDC056327]|uniref:tyrosine-protein phosphatase n=1 Tax=Kitasatospora sp. NPDC056327 TaxID=3345785 RepID=UPI0035DE0B90
MTRHLTFEGPHNFRDLGGYPAADGRTVRWGLVYRSSSLGALASAADLERFRALDIGTVIDLRYPWETARRGRIPELEGVAYHNLPIEHRPYDQAEIDPGVDPWRFLADRFAEVAEDGVAEIRTVLELIADAERPVVFHCAAGKDRTGLIAALVLSLLGVGEDDVAADFALTELVTDRLVAGWHAANPGRTLRWPSFGRAPEEVIRLALADLNAAHGSVHAYATGKVGVDGALIGRLRDRLLSAPSR